MNIPISLMSDETLDSAYATAYDSGNQADTVAYGDEIVARLATPWAFVAGVFGQERFQKYAQRTHFSQTQAAQSSVTASVSTLGDKVKAGLDASGITTGIILMILGAGVILWISRKP